MRPPDLRGDAGWAMLVLDDGGGEPLDRLRGTAMEVRRFLRMAIGITGDSAGGPTCNGVVIAGADTTRWWR